MAQHPSSENSWGIISNGRSHYHPSMNSGHYCPPAAQLPTTSLSNTTIGNGEKHWLGALLPTTPAIDSGTTTVASEGWSNDTNVLRSPPISGTISTYQSHSTTVQLNSGNTTSHTVTGGDTIGTPHGPSHPGRVGVSPNSPDSSQNASIATTNHSHSGPPLIDQREHGPNEADPAQNQRNHVSASSVSPGTPFPQQNLTNASGTSGPLELDILRNLVAKAGESVAPMVVGKQELSYSRVASPTPPVPFDLTINASSIQNATPPTRAKISPSLAPWANLDCEKSAGIDDAQPIEKRQKWDIVEDDASGTGDSAQSDEAKLICSDGGLPEKSLGGLVDVNEAVSGNGENNRNGDSGSPWGPTASFGSVGALLPTIRSENISPISTTPTRPLTIGQSPFAAYTAQQAATHANLHTCHICGFTSPSKFHFNSHMNTHADHKCDFCDYTSRTEGRLKRHMKEFHSTPQQSALESDAGATGGNEVSGEVEKSIEEHLQALMANRTIGIGSASMDNNATDRPAGASKSNTSSGNNKSKNYRCKQCDFVGKSKHDYWAHSRSHIKSDKILSCPNCPFVTEYKHHLEYHLRNHFGSKPFKCTKCNYSCVNKSMLNSHMKSHSNIYQFRCSDCTYATKYCHSLKLHLKKYGHTPVTGDGGTMVDGLGNIRGNRNRNKKGNVESGSRSSDEGPVSMVTTGGPLSATLPLTSPYQGTTEFFSESSSGTPIDQQQHTTESTGISSSTPSIPTFVEALLNERRKYSAEMVTSMARMGPQLPTVPSSVLAQNQQRSPPNQVETANFNQIPFLGNNRVAQSAFQVISARDGIQSALLKCNLCEFVCNNKETLTKHTMIHLMEKPDQLYHIYGLIASAAAQARVMAANASNLGQRPSERSTPATMESNDRVDSAERSPGDKTSGDEGPVGGHRRMRKGRAFKLESIAMKLQGKNYEEGGMEEEDAFRNVITSPTRLTRSTSPSTSGHRAHSMPEYRPDRSESVVNGQSTLDRQLHSSSDPTSIGHPTNIDWSYAYVCNYCQMAFKDCMMYTMHMGFHGYQEPYRCNTCGHISTDPRSMFLHIAREAHL